MGVRVHPRSGRTAMLEGDPPASHVNLAASLDGTLYAELRHLRAGFGSEPRATHWTIDTVQAAAHEIRRGNKHRRESHSAAGDDASRIAALCRGAAGPGGGHAAMEGECDHKLAGVGFRDDAAPYR